MLTFFMLTFYQISFNFNQVNDKIIRTCFMKNGQLFGMRLEKWCLLIRTQNISINLFIQEDIFYYIWQCHLEYKMHVIYFNLFLSLVTFLNEYLLLLQGKKSLYYFFCRNGAYRIEQEFLTILIYYLLQNDKKIL